MPDSDDSDIDESSKNCDSEDDAEDVEDTSEEYEDTSEEDDDDDRTTGLISEEDDGPQTAGEGLDAETNKGNMHDRSRNLVSEKRRKVEHATALSGYSAVLNLVDSAAADTTTTRRTPGLYGGGCEIGNK
jgi:hypothetical protein